MTALPVLVTCFSRPDLLEKSLSSLIKSECPIQVFVHIDGPRSGYPEDSVAIEQCKRIIEGSFRGDNLVIRSLEQNLGLRHAMLSAITWFFEHVDYGIIIEEDVVIHPDSLRIILALLKEYALDYSIGAISLHNNLSEEFTDSNCDLYLSNFLFLWGWATWKSRWNCIVGGIENPYTRLIQCGIRREIGVMGFLYFLRFLRFKARNSWDGDVQLNFWEKGYKTIHFRENLAWNIGFDDRATHTKLPIAQRVIYQDNLKELAKMNRCLTTSFSIEKSITREVFGIKGIREYLRWGRWFVKNRNRF